MSTATANSHLIQIMAGATLKLRIRRIEYYQETLATTAALGVVSVRRLTTAGTGGTALTISPLDPADAAAGATAMQLPTGLGTEGVSLWTGAAYYMQTAGASSPQTQPLLVMDFDAMRRGPLVVAAGVANGICIKQETAIAGAIARITVYFTEMNF